MAQFEISKTLVEGKVELTNYKEIEKNLLETLKGYQELKVSVQTYSEAKTKRAELNNFDKLLNRLRIDTKKEFLKPYETFEKQLKHLSDLVSTTSSEIDSGIKAIDDRQVDAKRFEIDSFYNEQKLPISLDRFYKKEWENKGYSLDTIKGEILEIKDKIDKDVNYIENHVANDDPLLKARIKETYLELLDLVSSIDKETEKNNQVKAIVREKATTNTDNGALVKDIDVILTVNQVQWYQVQNFVNSIGAKMKRKEKGDE